MPRGLGDDPLSRQKKEAPDVGQSGGSGPDPQSVSFQSPNDVFFRRKFDENTTERVAAPPAEPLAAPVQQESDESANVASVSQETVRVDGEPAASLEPSKGEPVRGELESPEEHKRGFFSRLFGRRQK